MQRGIFIKSGLALGAVLGLAATMLGVTPAMAESVYNGDENIPVAQTSDIIDPATPEKEGYYLTASDEFNGGQLNTHLWTDRYLPHWTTGELDKATYKFIPADEGDNNKALRVYVDKDRQPWDPSHDGQTQVSGIASFSRDYIHGWTSSYNDKARHFPAFRGFAQKYGYFEARIKAHQGDCTHVAFWLLGTQQDLYDGQKPERNKADNKLAAKFSAEIDITETLGAAQGGTPSYAQHKWGDINFLDGAYSTNNSAIAGKNFTNEYHVFGFKWMPGRLETYVDGKLWKSANKSPNYPMFPILNAYSKALGGGWTCRGGANPEGANYPVALDVDYFRAYQFKPSKKAEYDVADGYMRGRAVTNTDNNNNPSVAGWIGNGANNDVTLTSVWVPRDGEYDATLQLKSDDARTVKLQVNDETTPIVFSDINTHGVLADQPFKVRLKKGLNRMRFYNDLGEGKYAPDLGKLKIDIYAAELAESPVGKERDELKKANDELTEKNKALDAANRELEKANQKLADENDQLKKENKSLKDQIEELKKQLEEAKKNPESAKPVQPVKPDAQPGDQSDDKPIDQPNEWPGQPDSYPDVSAIPIDNEAAEPGDIWINVSPAKVKEQLAMMTIGMNHKLKFTNLKPNTEYKVVIHSGEKELGIVTANSDGKATLEVVLPADFEVGDKHKLVLTETKSDSKSEPIEIRAWVRPALSDPTGVSGQENPVVSANGATGSNATNKPGINLSHPAITFGTGQADKSASRQVNSGKAPESKGKGAVDSTPKPVSVSKLSATGTLAGVTGAIALVLLVSGGLLVVRRSRSKE